MFANHSANNRPPRWLGILTALLLLGMAGVLRFYRLEEAPPGLYPDIAANGVDALQVLRGHLQVFFPENNGREGMIIYLVAGMIHFMGRTVLALLLPSAVASVLTVLAVFLLCQTLYQTVEWDDRLGRAVVYPVWQGWIAGIIAAGLLAVSLGPIIIGRGGWRANLFPLFLALAIATLWNGFQRRSWLWIAIAGLCSGLVAYTYLAARVYPLLLLLFALSFVPDILRKRLKVPIPLLLGYVGISFVVALPMLLYFVANPGQLAARSSELLVVKADQSLLVNLRALSQNLLDHLAVFGWSGDPNPRHTYQQMPWLSPLEAILFWLGVGWLCWHWRKPVSRLLLLWLAIMLLPAVLAIDTPPNTLRMVGLLPAVYITIGTSVAHLVTLLHHFASKSFPNGQAFAIRETELSAIWALAQVFLSPSGSLHKGTALTISTLTNGSPILPPTKPIWVSGKQ